VAVTVVEIPEGSAKWYVRILWQVSMDKRFRKTKLIGSGDDGRAAAAYKAKLLNEAWKKFGTEAIKLIEDHPTPPAVSEEIRKVPTVAEYSPKFLQRMKAAGLKKTSYACYESNLRIHIEPVLGGIQLDKLNYTAVADFLSAKAGSTYSTARFRIPLSEEEEAKRPKGKLYNYSRDSIRIMAATLRAMMSEAVKDQYINVNPVAGVSRFYRKRKKDRIVTRSDVFQTIEDLHKVEDQILAHYPEYYEFTLCMSREGMRIGEVRALEIDDVNSRRNTFNINKNIPSGISGAEVEDSAKTDASEREEEFWSRECSDAISAMLKRRKADYFRKGEPMPRLLFISRFGRRIDYSDYLRAFKKAQKLAGMEKILSPHALRHTWASQNIAAGEDLASVSRHMGHANVGVTLTIYTHFLPKAKRFTEGVMDRKMSNGCQMEPIFNEKEFQRKP
jgi:integrase